MKGKIVYCLVGISGVEASLEIGQAGGIGMVLSYPQQSTDSFIHARPRAYFVPTVSHVSAADGLSILLYIRTTR